MHCTSFRVTQSGKKKPHVTGYPGIRQPSPTDRIPFIFLAKLYNYIVHDYIVYSRCFEHRESLHPSLPGLGGRPGKRQKTSQNAWAKLPCIPGNLGTSSPFKDKGALEKLDLLVRNNEKHVRFEGPRQIPRPFIRQPWKRYRI